MTKSTVTTMSLAAQRQADRASMKNHTPKTRNKGYPGNQSAVPLLRSKLESSARTSNKHRHKGCSDMRGDEKRTCQIAIMFLTQGKAKFGVNGLGTPQKQLLLLLLE